MNQHVEARDRWLGAICYLWVLIFIPLLTKNKSPFLARHCRQGFAWFLVVLVGFLFLKIIEATLGMIPFLGFILVLVLNFIFFLGVLIVSIMGFVRAMFGDEWRGPYLDDLADRVPID